MIDLAQPPRRILCSVIRESVFKFFRGGVNFLLYDAQHILQRMMPGKAEIRLIRHAAETGSHESSAAFNERPYFFSPPGFIHIIKRSGHKLIPADIRVHIYDIRLNAFLPERAVM